MFKRKIWLKFFVTVIILQMVLMPIAPVLAQELQNFSLEASAVNAEVKNVQVNNSNPQLVETQVKIQRPTSEDVVIHRNARDPFLLNTVTQPRIISVNLVAPVTDNSLNIPVSSSSVISVPTIIEVVQEEKTSLTSTENNLLNFAIPITASSDIAAPSLVSDTPIVIDVNTNTIPVSPQNMKSEKNILEKVVDAIKGINKKEDIKAIVEDPENVGYQIKNELFDEAVVNSTTKKIRLYQHPRNFYKDDSGIWRTISPSKKLFDELDSSKLRSSENGYEYTVALDGNSIKVSSGAVKNKGGASFLPNKATFSREEKDDSLTSKYLNIYPDTAVEFKDSGYDRQRTIIINKLPDNIEKDSELIYWEHYNYTGDPEILGWGNEPLQNGQEINRTTVLFKYQNGDIFKIDPAVVFDSSNDENAVNNVPYAVSINKENKILSLGIKLDTNYLLDESRVFPVKIDPVLRACSSIYTNQLTCAGYEDYYLRQEYKNNSLIQNDSVTYDPATGGLYSGYYKLATKDLFTREALIRFPVSEFEQNSTFANGEVTSAVLKMRYHGAGNGAAVSVPFSAKFVGTSWSSGVKYNQIVNSLLNVGNAKTVTYNSVGTWYSWSLPGSNIEDWRYFNQNYGLILEPSTDWDGNFAAGAPSWPNQLMIFDASESSNDPYIELTVTQSYADLVDGGMNTMTKNVYSPSETMYFTIGTKNVGNADSNSGIISYYVNPSSNCNSTANYIGFTNYGVLTGGGVGWAKQSKTYTLPSASGDYCLHVVIDSGNTTNENDKEGNNIVNISFTINPTPKPDLYFNPNPSLPSSVTLNQSLSVPVKVSNSGTASASSVSVELYRDDVFKSSQSFGTINNGDTVTKNFTLPTESIGNHTYKFHVVPASGEINTSNNDYSGVISVNGIPDFAASNFIIANTQTRYFDLGDTVTVNGRLQSLGTAGYTGVYYLLSLKDVNTGATYSLTNNSPSTLNLLAGYNDYINLTGTLPAGMPANGNYTVEVAVDPYNDITETFENNNITTTGNSVAVKQYYVGGGGGSGSKVDTDGDGIPDTAESVLGSNISGSNTIKAVDKPKYPSVKTTKNDGATPKSSGVKVANNPIQGTSSAGDPVNTRNGAFEFNQTDFALGGRGVGFNLVRSYDSKLSDFSGRVGNGWFDSYDIFYAQDAATKDIQIYLGGHLATYFNCPSHDGFTFIPERGRYETLTKNESTGFLEYRTLEGIKYIFGQSVGGGVVFLATQIVDANNNIVSLGYTTVRDIPLLTSVSDQSGRQMSFIYPTDTDPLWDKIKEVRENASGISKLVAQYTYDTNKNLIQVHQESNYSIELKNDIDHYFEYDANGRMLTYRDPRGTVLYNDYDATGRVTKQYEKNPRLGSNDKRLIYEFTYTDVADPNVAGSSHCTLVKNYRDAGNYYDEYNCYNSDELKIYSKKGNNIEKWEYNSDGMATKYTDALGNITNYTYDAKRRMTQQTLPNTAGWNSYTTYQYENNFNRLTKKMEFSDNLLGPISLTPKTTDFTVDPANGNITAIHYPDATSESFQYDSYGNVKKYINKNNAATDYMYDGNGNYLTSETVLITQADNTSQTIIKQYGYDAYGHRTSYIDPNGKIYTYGYDTRGNLRVETDPLLNSTFYKYDLEDHKISQTDALGHETQYEYDTDLNASLLSVTKLGVSGNIVNSRQYDYVGNVVKEIDGNGNIKNYTYTAENWPATIADAKRTVSNEYYDNGWLKKQTDSEGRRTDYFYDSRGNKTETRAYYDASNFISNKFVYDGFNRVESALDGKNDIIGFVYDKMDRLIQKTDAKNGVYGYFYDAVGNKIGERSPRAGADASLRNSYGYSVYYIYDAANRPTKQINADDKITWYLYDANGNITKTIVNQNGDGTLNSHITQYTYFDNNWKKTEVDAYGKTTAYTYYANGTVKTKVSPAGLTATYTYDDFNRLTKETDNAGLATNYTYDSNNNKKSITYPDTTKTQYTYNALNLSETAKDALNGLRQFEYDGAGNKTKEINKMGKATNFVYDKLNRLTSETNAAGTVTNYAYDNNSNRTAETVGVKTTGYEYDELNRNTKITYPGNKIESVNYDADGNIKDKTDGKGQKIVYTYDKLNRPITKILPGGFTVQYIYDNWNNLTNLTDESGTTQYTYDKLNRNTNETKTFIGLIGKNYTVVRAYNADGQLSAITDTANCKFDYNYNTRGLLDNVKFGAATLAKYTYSDFGKPNSIEYGNGVKTNLNYDELNRVKDISTNSGTTTLFSQKYFYDAHSNRITMNDGTDSTTTYNYDELEQLTNVNINNNGNQSALAYNYDIYGNRTTQTNPLSNASYTYTSGTNELDKVVYNNRLTIASTFDGNSSLTKEIYTKLGKADKDVTYTWDTQNRLAQINYHYGNRPAYLPTIPDNTLNFTYDDYGNRTKKQTANGAATYYFNSGNVVLNEIGATGTTTKSIAYGLSPIAEIDQNGIITYVHQDTLGSTVLTTDQTGNTVAKYEYDPFGQIIGMVSSPSSFEEGAGGGHYLYTGQEYDQESDLYYYNARYYNPRLGRFISRDPVLGRDGDSLSRNGFIYVKNNPLKYVDPSGEEEEGLGVCKVESELYWSQGGDNFGDYVSDSFDQLIYGNYTDKVTGLGTAGQLGTGLIGIDLPGDIRDISYDLTNWEWSWEHVGQTVLDGISFFPVIGALKYTDEAAALLKDSAKIEKSLSKAPDFIVTPKGDVFPVPKGATGPIPADSGKGFKYTGGSGGNGLSESATDFRFMDPVNSGKYQYPDGYGSYSNSVGQTVNPLTGKTIPKSDPWWHIW